MNLDFLINIVPNIFEFIFNETRPNLEAATRVVLQENVFLEISQNSQENTCARVSFLMKLQVEACNFIKNETLAQVFSCELCEISKNNFLIEHLRWLLLYHQPE